MTRKSGPFLITLSLLLAMCIGVSLHSAAGTRKSAQSRRAAADLVRRLELTDLCLFPEANYTRHLSQADRHAPFQDAPTALEHFPSGSIASPPAVVRGEPNGND
jgi:hypothetical protein